jgi:peptide/nickel transport system substrate-binding protein
MVNMYEKLITPNPDGTLSPGLATSWESSSDALTWTFQLRDGVKFHGGDDLTAEAVKQSIEAYKEYGSAGFIWDAVESIDTPDDLTVVLNLSYPAAIDLIASAAWGSWIVSPTGLAARAADETYWETGLGDGTGPYKLDSYRPDQDATFSRFDDYWGGWDGSHYSGVIVSITPEATLQLQKLQGGEADVVQDVPAQALESLANDPNFTIEGPFPTWENQNMWFNTKRPGLDNKLVRQALSWATPYEDIIEVGPLGNASQAHSAVPAGVFPFDESVPQYTYDLDRARDLMAQAGFPDGGINIELTITQENQAQQRYAPLIKESFAELGVEVTITSMLFIEQRTRMRSAIETERQDAYIQQYAPTYADAGIDNLAEFFKCEPDTEPHGNRSYWCNPAYDELIDEAILATATDKDRAQELYNEAMNMLYDEAPAAFLFDLQTQQVVPKAVGGYVYNLNYPGAPFVWYGLHPAG